MPKKFRQSLFEFICDLAIMPLAFLCSGITFLIYEWDKVLVMIFLGIIIYFMWSWL